MSKTIDSGELDALADMAFEQALERWYTSGKVPPAEKIAAVMRDMLGISTADADAGIQVMEYKHGDDLADIGYTPQVYRPLLHAKDCRPFKELIF